MLRVWKKTKQRTNEVSVLQIRAVITALTQSVNTDATLRFAHTLQSVTHGVVARVFVMSAFYPRLIHPPFCTHTHKVDSLTHVGTLCIVYLSVTPPRVHLSNRHV